MTITEAITAVQTTLAASTQADAVVSTDQQDIVSQMSKLAVMQSNLLNDQSLQTSAHQAAVDALKQLKQACDDQISSLGGTAPTPNPTPVPVPNPPVPDPIPTPVPVPPVPPSPVPDPIPAPAPVPDPAPTSGPVLVAKG